MTALAFVSGLGILLVLAGAVGAWQWPLMGVIVLEIDRWARA